ncbi:translocation/assembly module TamB domain-containing protein [Neptunicella marina]|uniref:Translocation/assembly module TamB domain-containing protein n=1 Tax=Neptunicella marina TaxID=2125989 RepID=A0A8J6IR32_9ALTE|nr:translocation/assembly module TamB domain-containing protein [Neptunicella marina]MBC3766000.1 translocation/assembly module TamB domain-containing protein [Neptunicella marina]
MMKKFFIAVLVFIVGITLFTLGMLYSPWGSRVLIGWIDHQIDSVEIDYQSGAIGAELALSKVIWKDGDSLVALKNVQTRLRLPCLLSVKLCIESISIEQIEGKLLATQQQQTSQKSTGTFSSPIDVDLQQFTLGKAQLNYDDSWLVSVTQFNSRLSLNKNLDVAQLHMGLLSLQQLADSDKQTTQQLNAAYFQQLQYQPPTLKDWRLPLNFVLHQMRIEQIRYQAAAGEMQQINDFQLQAKGEGAKITLQRFAASYQQWQLNLNGKITTRGQYPNQLELNVTEHSKNKQVAELQWQAQGDLSAWKHQLSVSGPYAAQASAQLNLLKASLPVSLNAAWQELGWPLNNPQWHSKNGIVKINGNLQQFSVELSNQLTGKSIPITEIALQAQGNRQRLSIDTLIARLLEGQIDLSGTLLLGNNSELNADVVIQHIDASQYWPELKSQINGNLKLTANASKDDWHFQLSPIDIHGKWREHALNLSGQVKGARNLGLEFKQLMLNSGDNRLTLNGTLDNHQEMQSQLQISASNLSQLWPGLAGVMQMDASVDGVLSQPHAIFSVDASKLQFDEWTLSKMQGQGDVRWNETKPVDIRLTVQDLTSLNHQLEQGEIRLTGNADQHRFDINLQGDGAGFNAQLQGQYQGHQWKGQWQTGEIVSKYAELSLIKPFAIEADWQQQQFKIGDNCWQHQTSSLCISDASYNKQQANWSLQISQLPIAPILNRFVAAIPQVDTSSELSLNMQGHWDSNALPKIAMQMQLSGDEWRFTNKNAVALSLDPASINIDMDNKNMHIESRLSGKQIGQFVSKVTISPKGDDKLLSGHVEFERFDLHPFINLLPQLDTLAGIMQGRIELDGSLQQPLLNGQMNLHQGAISGSAIPVVATAIEQTLQLKGQYADIDGTYQLGSGKGEINGELHWLPDVSASLNITGTDLELTYQNILRGTLTPNVQVAFTQQKIDVSGRIQIPYARVKLKELPESAVSPSDDVVMIDEPQAASDSAQKLNLDLLVQIDPGRNKDVKLDAFGLTTDLQGELRLAQASDNLLADGEVTLLNGRYRAYGQNLLIKEGELIFHGPVSQPHVALEAIRDPSLTADDVTAGIRVNGSAKAPKVSVFSDPVMEQPQALSYLLRGRGLNSANDQGQDAMLTTMLLGLGLSRSENLVGRVGHKLGVKDLTLDTSGQGDNTQLALTGYIAPGVQLRYGLGVFNSASEVALRYELTSSLYLEAVSGLNNALDLYYSFSVGEDEQDTEKQQTASKVH